MCRIFGISYGPGGWQAEGITPSELSQIMAPALVAKGPHSYGYMINDGGDIYYDKWAGRSDTDIAQENLGTIEDGEDVRWLVGHTRWATHGSPEDNRNNHPLQHGNVVGVHNGVLVNHEAILEFTGRQDPKTEVDSEAIFAAVNEWGHREGLRRVTGKLVTVYTHLDKPDTLHIARSYGRELYYAKTVAGSLIFASEVQAIEKVQEFGLELAEDPHFFNSNTLIRVRQGKVRSRIEYRTPERSRAPHPAEREDWETIMGRMRAISRGIPREELYDTPPPAPQRKPAPPATPAPRDRDEMPLARKLVPGQDIGIWDDDRQTYHFKGRELSEAEYVAEMMDLLEIPH